MASGRTADLGTSDEWFKQELRYHVRRLLEDDQGRLETFRSCDPRAIAEIVKLMERYKRSTKEVIDRVKKLITKRRHKLKLKRKKEADKENRVCPPQKEVEKVSCDNAGVSLPCKNRSVDFEKSHSSEREKGGKTMGPLHSSKPANTTGSTGLLASLNGYQFKESNNKTKQQRQNGGITMVAQPTLLNLFSR